MVRYLKYALALVLIFIVGKMPAWISLSVTIGVLAAGVLYSLYRTRSLGTESGAASDPQSVTR